MKQSRRRFLKQGVAGSVAAVAGPAVVRCKADRPLRVAAVGISGRCVAHYEWMSQEKVVALCDVDRRAYEKPSCDRRGTGPRLRDNGIVDTVWSRSSPQELFPEARFYDDYRDLFAKPDSFDAVVVCTPDHHHYPVAMRALQAGKAVYCEKPLTWSTWEAQQLAATTAKHQLATQMGNQGMGIVGWRIAHAYYTAGAIGEVTEVHAWCPCSGGTFGTPNEKRPEGEDPVPPCLKWDLWLGPAPTRPYKEGVYHPFRWRQWVDFGCGTLGDVGSHMLNVMFKVLRPAYPSKVEMLECSDFNCDSYPRKRVIRFTFPERGKRAGFVLYWHDGDARAPRPKDLEAERELCGAGLYFLGAKGTLIVAGAHNNSAYLIPESARKQFGRPRLRAPESRGHIEEFVAAAKGQLRWDEPLSNFVYGGLLSGVVSLGNAVLRSGVSLEIDPETGRVMNSPDPEKLIKGREARPGWMPV